MRTLTAFVLALSLLSACPKGGGKPQTFSEEELSRNPAANFQAGVDILTHPDKRTGAVDYASAYNRFNASANLGGGPKASFNAGWVAEQLGRPADAEGHYRKAWETDPTYESAMFSLARVLEEQGKAAEAVDIYKANAEKNPTNWEARNEYVAALIAAGRHDDALAEAQEILRHKPDDATVYRNLSALYYTQQNYSLSQLTAEKALQINAGDPGVYNNMGVTFLIQGDEPSAIEKFKTAIKLQSTNFEANMNLGYVALNSGDYALAKTCFEAATQANPASLDAKLGHAVAQRGLKDYKAAGSMYDEIISADPQYDAAYLNAARLHYLYTKDFAEAMKYLQRYVDMKAGTLPPTHAVFAEMEKVKSKQAEEEARKAEEQRKIEEEKARQKRNEELLATMATTISTTKTKLTQNAACIDPGSIEEVTMILDQAQQVVDAKDTEMAPDIQSLLDAYVPAVDDAIANCDPSLKSAPPPEGGGETPPAPAPEGGGETPPAPAPAPQ